MIDLINKWLSFSKNNTITDTMRALAQDFPEKVVFSTSFGQEDQAITDIIAQNQLDISIFTLDTGRLFEETYEVFHKTKNKYKIPIKVFSPNNLLLEKLITDNGPNSFYQSIENRKECCYIRKVEPLKRALQGNKIWITGLRAEQSESRSNLNTFEWDETLGIIKYHPLLDWDHQKLTEYLNENSVPQNSLHKKGFISIGCAPCTRAITEGEPARAGRWWWEDSHKECGLHAN